MHKTVPDLRHALSALSKPVTRTDAPARQESAPKSKSGTAIGDILRVRALESWTALQLFSNLSGEDCACISDTLQSTGELGVAE